MADNESDFFEAAFKKPAENLLGEWLASLATLLFEATFDFWGNLIKLLTTYGNHKVL